MTAESFFATIATITATIIGFALTIFAVYFRIIRERQLEQTEVALASVKDFATEYQSVVSRTKSLLLSEAGPELDRRFTKLWALNSPNELKEFVGKANSIYTETAYLYALLDGIEHFCETIANQDISADEIPNVKMFETQSSLIEALRKYSSYHNETGWKKLNRELSDLESKHFPATPLYDDDLLPEPQSRYYPDSLYHWIEEQDEEFFREYEQYDVNGLGMPGLRLFAYSMESDWKPIMRKLRGSLVDYGPERDMLKFVHKPASIAIVVFGLLIPLFALVETPRLAQLVWPAVLISGSIYSDVVIELIQIATVPILLVSFYCQFMKIHAEIINTGRN